MIGLGLATGRSGGAGYLLRDEFSSNLAAGNVNGTVSEPGPGTRVTVETAGLLWQEGGTLRLTGASASYSYPAFRIGSVTRTPGLMLISKCTHTSFTGPHWGFIPPAQPHWNMVENGAYSAGNTLHIGGVGAWFWQTASPGTQIITSILRAAGMVGFRVVSNRHCLVAMTEVGSTSVLAVGGNVYISGWTAQWDYMRIPATYWLPTPLVSDGFGSSFGTSDGLGHAEGVAGGLGSGGNGKTWSNAGPTWSVSGATAINTAPSGLAQEISVVETSTPDVFVRADLTQATGNVGLALNIDDASHVQNGVLVYLDGTNCVVDKIVAGSVSNVRTTAVTHTAGKSLFAAKIGSEYRVYYGATLVGTLNTISDAGIVSSTLHGLYSTNVANAVDNFVCYATGTRGEYAVLDNWS